MIEEIRISSDLLCPVTKSYTQLHIFLTRACINMT